MAFIRGQSQAFTFTLIKRSNGEAITNLDGVPSVFFTVDSEAQVEAGATPVYQGNDQWLITFTGGEVQGTTMGIITTHSLAVTESVVVTVEELTTVTAAIVTVTASGSSISDTFEYYGTLTAADQYFNFRLSSDSWTDATVADREKALIQATRAIERLNYANHKNVSTQTLQFPRGDDTVIPREIEYANYEIGIKLLEGVDSEVEAQSLGVMSEAYSGAKTAYQAGFVNEHLRAGIPSILAWEYLKPFLRDNLQLNLTRVN